jgi:uncharacterized protein DUF1707
VAAGPGDQMAAAEGRGHIRASDADREQVIDVLKDAFVRGRLTKDELSVRAGRALVSRTYAELTGITAGILVTIPAWLTEAPPPKPDRVPARKPMNKKAVAWTTCMIILPPTVWAAFLTFSGGFIVLLVFAFVGLVVTTGPMYDAADRR